MKYTTTLLKLTILLAILSFSSVNPSVYAQATPNSFLETGDEFTFFQERDDYSSWNWTGILANDSDPSQLYRYEARLGEEAVFSDSNIYMRFLRPSDAIVFPDDFDTAVRMDIQGDTLDGSNRNETKLLFDAGPELNGTWENTTTPVDLSGRKFYEGGDKDGVGGFASNSTYAIIFPEMVDDSTYFGEYQWFFPFRLDSTFDGSVPLAYRTVSEYSDWFIINSANATYNVINVASEFTQIYSENISTMIPMGPGPDDGNNPPPPPPLSLSQNDQPPQDQPPMDGVQVNGSLDLSVSYYYEYVFDKATGMVLEVYESKEFSVDLSLYNPLVNITQEPMTPPPTLNQGDGGDPNMEPQGPQTFEFTFEVSISGSTEAWTTMDESSVGYGKTRPTSSGNNRLEEGDVLTFYAENGFDQSSYFDMSLTPAQGGPGFERSENGYSSDWAEGTTTFEVYRHNPGFFNAATFEEGTRGGEYGGDWTETGPDGTNSDSYYEQWGDEPYATIGFFDGASTDQYEVMYFFPEELFVPGLGGEGDGIPINAPPAIQKSGAMYTENKHYDFNASDQITINGFTYTYVDVEVVGQDYYWTETSTQPIRMGDPNDPNAPEIMVTINVEVSASIQFFYEVNSRVLLRNEMNLNVYVTLSADQQINGENGATFNLVLDGGFDMEAYNAITLKTHPKELLTAQGPDTYDHSTVTDSTNSTSTTTTTAGNDTQSSSNTPNLPAPAPFGPFVVTFVATAVVIRRRRK